MKVRVIVQGNFGGISYFHEVAGEGDLGEAIAIAIDRYREADPERSIFEATITVSPCDDE